MLKMYMHERGLLMMIEQLWGSPDIFRILVPLPENPLKGLNVYVLRTKEQALVIDTGFRREECRKALWDGISELGLDLSKTSLFLTHLHSDHTGLVWDFVNKGIPVYMSKREISYQKRLEKTAFETLFPRFRREGFPDELLKRQVTENQGSAYSARPGYPVNPVEDNASFMVGEYEVKAFCTPGHTPGHMVLYLPEQQLLFSGDHVLFDISPNITSWPEVEDSLGDYLESLKRLRNLPVQAVFPAHRGVKGNLATRIDELLAHHERRLTELKKAIDVYPGANAYELAGHLSWSMRGLSWDQFPPGQKWFAVGETMAHLDHLAKMI
jgi:glyoxylase-like metal-dependent hydrolase (beta-lactamase superfamily II)